MSNSLLQKIQDIRVELRNANLRMTGKNKFADYEYFELEDFLPTAERLMQKYKITAIPSFTKEEAILRVYDCESDSRIDISSPMGTANLKGCHEVQNIGAVETYQRRYLYQALFDIGEKDGLDGTNGKDDQQGGDSAKQPPKPTTTPQKASAPQATQRSGGMSLEQAREYKVTWGQHKGKIFGEMPEKYLRYVYENTKEVNTKEAARIILESIEHSKKVVKGEEQASMDDYDDQLPF